MTDAGPKAHLHRYLQIARDALVWKLEGLGEYDATDNPLRNAPHTLAMLAGEWERPYPRTTAVYPLPGLQGRSYLSPVRRIDQAYGDRNLVCSCPPPEAFAEHDFGAHEVSGNGSEPSRSAGAPDDLGTAVDVVGSSA